MLHSTNEILEIFALFMFLGIFTTFLIPETKRKTLEELAGEVPGTANYDPETAGHTRKESIAAAQMANSQNMLHLLEKHLQYNTKFSIYFFLTL